MGLDWIAGNKAKPGHEAEFNALLEAGEDGITEEMQERYSELSISAYTVVDAPIVGKDKVADAWILCHERMSEDDEDPPEVDLESVEASTPQTDEEREVLKEMAGYHVLDLAPPSDGLPLYSHGGMMDELDRTSFRGKFLHDCEEIIGDELMNQAYEDQTPEQLDAYGKLLLEHARRFSKAEGCPEIENQEEPPEDLESAAGLSHILFAAGRWCCYWGSRGFSLNTWS